MWRTLFTCLLFFLLNSVVLSQKPDNPDYIALYNDGKYNKALDILKLKLVAVYDKRVDNKRIPSDIISVKTIEQMTADEGDVNYLFRIRKAKSFFIENNKELSDLHLYAARSYFKTEEYDSSLNHFYQALRFKEIEFEKDDVIYYEMSQVYKEADYFNAYTLTLESAYTLNPAKIEYSLELGKALKSSTKKKKAIYHLERYIKAMGEQLDNPELYLLTANLNEDIGRYLETIKYYKKYLKKKEKDGHIYFALGYIAFKRAGDYDLALQCFNKTLELLPEDELFRRSKAYEYTGDIQKKELEFDEAVKAYLETVKYQDRIKQNIKEKDDKIQELDNKIREVKSILIKEREKSFDKYNEYEYLQEERGKLGFKKKELIYEYSKFNPGKVRWELAELFERLEKLDDSIKYYREAISFDYKSNQAREKIIKLQLKRKRGY